MLFPVTQIMTTQLQRKDKRNEAFDITRALCILYIVGFWHLINYFPTIELNNLALQIGSDFTIITLGTFTFMSAYFLKKYTITTLSDVKYFYKKRIRRFYIPYLICLIVLFIGGWFENKLQFFYSLIGLSTYLCPNPKTIWYLSMLISFYILTPPLLFLKKEKGLFLIISFILILLFAIFGKTNGLYFPFYLLGLSISENNIKYLISTKGFIILGLSILILFLIQNFFGGIIIWKYSLIFCGVFLLLKIASKLHEYTSFKFWNIIAYSSMMAYLYHRIHYKIINIIIHPHDTISITLFIVIGITSLFIASYYMQRCYDYFSNKY